MKIKKLWVLLAIALVVGLSLVAVAGAQMGAYQIDWWVVAGGGGASDSGLGYRLSGTAGQAAAGPVAGSPRPYQVNSGYWVGMALAGHHIYLPAVVKG